ncbi:MAG: hypothetical protein GX997_09240 [Bacteroidales bacterium]|jgi:hypothetical protein|nr:hypothetical protein [Bacteroidales bacterium]
MNKTRNAFFLFLLLLVFVSCEKESLVILTLPSSSQRLQFGVEHLRESLKDYKLLEGTINTPYLPKGGRKLIVLEGRDSLVLTSLAEEYGLNVPQEIEKEGFYIATQKDVTLVYGEDPSGALYGCYRLADELKEGEAFPKEIVDAPEMVLRGACVGLQKPYLLPGRGVYEYPYTPENFPWFYDKDLWIRYLNMLVEYRMNTLYLWNGHPFASLVKLEDYPFAVEVDEETFKKNEEMFAFLTKEAGKRGIWVIQMFYNIIVSKPFAEHYGIKTQDRNRPITPLLSDYTCKSISAFIRKYPNVGLLVCLGEAMATYEDDVKWFTETIIPGVKDGLKALGRTDEPPIILRAHDTDCKMVMEKALPLYKNLYTMHKYNGESLTTYEPRGPWSQIHRELSSLGSVHIDNVHILANLEPFRYGSPDFIQKSVQAMHRVHGANGLHLYPQASYWDWPYTADKLPEGERLLQINRDWIWYKSWGRYAWKADRPRHEEEVYWSDQLGNFYGCGKAGRDILEAYEQAGEISPKLTRRFAITEGNRQTFLLGMFMSQLVNPYKYKIYPGFYESCGPEGEKLIEYVEKKWKNEKHIGELPLDVVVQAKDHANKAVAAIEKAAKKVKKNKDEFLRLKNDIYCYREFAYFFGAKVKAAERVLDYQYSNNIDDLEAAIPFMEESLKHYRKLVSLTKDTYLYANSMQTAQRRIPIGGDDGKYKTWEELLPLYEQEFRNFKKNLRMLKTGGSEKRVETISPFVPAEVILMTPKAEWMPLVKGRHVIPGIDSQLKGIAPELKNMKVLKLEAEFQKKKGTVIEFDTRDSVKLLVGYFRTDQKGYAMAPVLETNASANQYGQAEPVLMNALAIENQPAVNIHAYSFPAGRHTVSLGKGICLILGFTQSDIEFRNVGLMDDDFTASVDWLFY